MPKSTSKKLSLSVSDKNLLPKKTLSERLPNPDSLIEWVRLYLQIHVAGGSQHTRRAKHNDLKKFTSFFVEGFGKDHVDNWTPSVSKAFQQYLQTGNEKRVGEEGKPLAATSINRIMATLRHFAQFLHRQRPLLAGNPMDGVRDIQTDSPDWKGLSPRDVMRLKVATEQREKACTRKDQNPLLESAVFYCLLYTGMRESELASLNVGQYHHRGFHEVKRKGSKVSRKVPLPTEAREKLDRYLEDRVGEEALSENTPLFVTRYGNRLHPRDIYRIAQRICNQANVSGDSIKLTPHMLRHTFLKRVADKHGVHTAQEMSGNVGMKEIFRYTKPSQEEMERIAEELI